MLYSLVPLKIALCAAIKRWYLLQCVILEFQVMKGKFITCAFSAFEGLEDVSFSHAPRFFRMALFFAGSQGFCVGFSLFSLQPTVMKFSFDHVHIAIRELSNQDVHVSSIGSRPCHGTSLG